MIENEQRARAQNAYEQRARERFSLICDALFLALLAFFFICWLLEG